jgi:stage IV sporulation protein FB
MSPNFDLSAANRGAWSFHLFGVWVRVQIWLWIILLILAGERDPRDVLIWVGVCFVSLLLHEFGHVIAFRLFGVDSTVILQAWGGLTAPRRDVHGAMPNTLVALAGPAAGFLLVGVVLIAGYFTGFQVRVGWHLFLPSLSVLPPGGAPLQASLPYYWLVALNDFLFVNLYWGIVNLLPVYPLDGGQIARAVMDERDPYGGRKRSLILSAVAGAGAALLGVALKNLLMVMLFGLLAGLSAMEAERTRGGRRPYRPGEGKWR